MPNNVPVVDAGDIAWIDLDPTKGHEQAGRRPALVLSPAQYHQKSAIAIICPITSTGRANWPFKVPLPPGLQTSGYVLVDQIRTIDRNARPLKFIEKVPAKTLADVRGLLAGLLQL
jgi:mRNA interferase MazF